MPISLDLNLHIPDLQRFIYNEVATFWTALLITFPHKIMNECYGRHFSGLNAREHVRVAVMYHRLCPFVTMRPADAGI